MYQYQSIYLSIYLFFEIEIKLFVQSWQLEFGRNKKQRPTFKWFQDIFFLLQLNAWDKFIYKQLLSKFPLKNSPN
jgi:hypothetical protein